MNISRETIQAAFGLDQSITLSPSTVLRDPNIPFRKTLLNNLPNDFNKVRYISRLSSVQKFNWVNRHPSDLKYITGIPWWYYERLIENKPGLIKYIPSNHPVYKSLCKKAVKLDGLCLRYCIFQTDDLCLSAVKQDGLALQYVEQQTLEICAEAVMQSEGAIQFVQNKSQEFYLWIIEKYPYYWHKIQDTPENRRRAIRENRACITQMTNVSDDLILWCLKEGFGNVLLYIPQTPELCLRAIKENPDYMEYIDDQTQDLCELAIRKLPSVIRSIRNPSSEMQRMAVSLNSMMIAHIDQTDEFCRIAIANKPELIKHITNPSEEICLLAVNQNGMLLDDIKDQTDAVCLAAIRNNPKAFEFVMNQTPEIARLAVQLDHENVYHVWPSIIEDIAYENKYGNL